MSGVGEAIGVEAGVRGMSGAEVVRDGREGNNEDREFK